jgi:hypothetical protein
MSNYIDYIDYSSSESDFDLDSIIGDDINDVYYDNFEISNILDEIVLEQGVTNIIMDYKLDMDDVNIIEKNNNNWVKICESNEIGEYFIEKYIDKIYWDVICEKQYLSEDFILRHSSKINYLSLVEKGNIEHFSNHFYKTHIMPKYDEEYEERRECEEALQQSLRDYDNNVSDDYFDDMDDWVYYNGHTDI